jgi:cobalt-zinc-cadmium resistance protein CzcA
LLEKTTAETQRGTIAIQLRQLQQDLDLIQSQFMLLINTNNVYTPNASSLKMTLLNGVDSSSLNKHPSLKILEQRKIEASIGRKLERSKLLPDLNVGFFSMTMKGNGADNVFYTSSSRFNALQIGLGVPLFFGSQKAKVEASKINQSIAENSYLLETNLLQYQLKTNLSQYKTDLAAVQYFENTGLKNATLILSVANKQFESGEINFMEWVILTNQSITIQSNYLDAIKNLNETSIQINYLISK